MSDTLLKIIPNCSDISSINHIAKNKFSYTDRTGITKYYLFFISYKDYKKNIVNIPHKLIKSNSFYIAKLI